MVSEKRIDYVIRTSIKIWNLYNVKIIAYFKKRFSSYLTEMGLSWKPFLHPRSYIGVRNPQTKELQFMIFLVDDQHGREKEDRFLNMDLNHLLFFDINEKEKELNVLNKFNELLKINKTTPFHFLNRSFIPNPLFILILYDSTNEVGHFQPPKFCSISIPSYSDLSITEQKHFDVKGFYEWLNKNTDRPSIK